MKRKTDLLFVYGSLMRGEAAERMLHDAAYLRTGHVEGFALYDLGQYPGIYPARESSRVTGELFRMKDPASTLTRLDAFEDVPHLFRIEGVKVSGSAPPVEAWAYVLAQDPRARYPRIPQDHWPAYRRAREGKSETA